MNNIKIIFFIFLSLITLKSMGQSDSTLSKLFDKKWTISFYEIGGQKFPATDVSKDDFTIFYHDQTQKSSSHGQILTSKWTFDKTKSLITLYADESKTTTLMKVMTLDEKLFVSEITTEDMVMVLHMTTDANK